MNDKRAQYLIEGITKDIVACLMEDEALDMAPSIAQVHNSETFARLSDTATACISKVPPMCTRY